MADPRINNINIFEDDRDYLDSIVAGFNKNVPTVEDDRDYLDRAVGAYEENVPLIAQIGMGFTPPGIGIDIAEATKYGRDAFRDLKQGNLSSGAINVGIAGLSALGAIPLVGDLLKAGGKPTLKGLAKSIRTTDATDIVPVNKIKIKDTTGSGRGADAKANMQSNVDEVSYKGVKADKRQPIEVLENPDGSFTALGGNSTLRILKNEGVDNVPIKKYSSRAEFNQQEQIRQANKALAREGNAVKLVPEVGSPSLETIVRSLGGSKLEKAVAKKFNAMGNHFKSIDEMHEVSKQLNRGFQRSIDEIAGSLNLKTVGNPGETNIAKGVKVGAIDPETGHIFGTVKKTGRMKEKAIQKYDGDTNQITDAIRTRILAETPEEADRIAKEISERFPTIDSGNQVNTMGLRDRKLNILYTDPQSGKTIIAEIGITPADMHIASEKAHKFYEPWRKTMAKYTGTKVPAEVRMELINQENAMRYFFRQAEESIDPSWLGDMAYKGGKVHTPDYARKGFEYVEKFAVGGQVVGNVGKSSPIIPNVDSKSGLESLSPLMAISAYKGPSPSAQSLLSPRIKNTSSKPASRLSEKTAGSPSQEKYNVSSASTQDSIQNYKNKSTDKPLIGGRREIQ